MIAKTPSVLLAVAVLVIGCADPAVRRAEPSPPPAASPPPASPPPAGPPAAGSSVVLPAASNRWPEAVEQRIFELTNYERRDRGLSVLRSESTLAEVAREHSSDMLTRGYFAHESPEGEDAHDRIATRHRRLVGLVGENIWSGSGYVVRDPRALAREIVDDWMNSSGHRRNILRPDYTHLGVGVATAGSEIRATQNFALARAYLARPLADRLPRGAEPDLRSTPFDGASPAELFDLWSPRRRQGATEPAPVDAPRLDAAPGRYALRLYFPDAPGSYAIYFGPRFELRP